jgi:hypothetical protein
MTKTENRQRIKNEALKKIVKIYDYRSQNRYSHYEEDGSCGEQRDSWVQGIIQRMEYELEQLNKKE